MLECFLLAKKFLRVPNAVYINRPRAASVSRVENDNINVENYLHKNILPLREGFNELERVMAGFDFFREHADYRYAVLNFFGEKSFSWFWPMLNIYAQIPTFKLDEFVRREFHAEDAPFAAYLFNTVNVYRLQLMKIRQEIHKIKQEKSHGKK